MTTLELHRAGLQSVAIEGFTLADHDEIVALWRRAGLRLRPSDEREAVALAVDRDPGLFLVARRDGRAVGTVMGGWDGRRAYIYHLAVEPGLRRRGIATALMDELERRLRDRGALKAKLQVVEGNEASLALFAGRGYEVETMCTPLGKELVAGGAPLDWRPPSASESREEPS